MINFLPALISGGASILGGLLNPKKDNRKHNLAVAKGNMRRTEITNKREIKWNRQVEAKAKRAGSFMMAEAERLGINPITYLQSGGLSHAFNVATVGLAKPAFQTHIRPEEAYTTSGVTTGQAIGDGLGAFASTLVSTMQQEQQNNFQRELVSMQLAAANSRGSGSGYSFNPPAAVLFGSSGARHVTGGPGQSGHVVPGGTTFSTHYGTGVQPVARDVEAMEAALGQDVTAILDPVIYGPPALSQPENQRILQQSWSDWVDIANQFGRWANNRLGEYYERTGPAAKLREAQGRSMRRSIAEGINSEDAIFGPGFW